MVRRRTQGRKKRAGHPSLRPTLGPAPANRSGGALILVLAGLVLVNLYVFVWNKKTGVAAIKREAEAKSAQPDPMMSVGTAPLAPAAGSADGAPLGPPGVVEGKVEKSDTLGRLLKRNGLSAPEADEVIRSLSGKLDFRQIRAGQTFRIERGADGRVELFELELSKTQKVRAERDSDGELQGSTDEAQTRVEVKTLGGTIDSSLYAAITKAGETGALVDFFVDVFAYDIDFFNDTHDGDTFHIVVEKHFMAGPDGGEQFARYGKILAAEYKGKAGTFQTFYWNGKYYDASGSSSERGMLKTPLKFVRVSSGFDRNRMHPVLHTVRAHLGIDYAAPVGTPVRAAAPGRVIVRAPSGGAGNMVMIAHDGGIQTAYMHLSKFANIKVGDHVEAKTVIGYVGTTGLSTGPHLHFGVKQNGVFVDPTKLAPIKGKPVPAKEMDAFRAESARLSQLLATSDRA
jgi:murein DD-endopeptidase MepM/ murein hydrolase activator NlpD